MRKKVIIVGAGAAGLMAARELVEQCDVVVVDGQARPGGRIRSFALERGEGVVEAGAEFIHGELPLTGGLIRSAGLTTVKVEGKMYRYEHGVLRKETEMIEGWDELVAEMKNAPPDQTMQQFLDQHFFADKFWELRDQVRSFVHGFDLAPLSEVTVQSLYEEWSAEGEQFFLKEGYGKLVDVIVQDLRNKGCVFVLGDAVAAIRWNDKKVSVSTGFGRTMHANHALVTVPLSILRDPLLVTFIPSIPEYHRAAADIGFGTALKVVFDFHEKFWQKDLSFVFSREQIPTWWSHSAIPNNLLTGWAGGPDALRISHLSDEEIIGIAHDCLEKIFKASAVSLRDNIRRCYVFNWIRESQSYGAYSYSKPASTDARQILNTPIEETLYFAGEGLFEGSYPGTVEAAFHSGLQAARKIMNS
jgi:monoamine oxidase